jgi:hypothetical protein
MAATENPQGTVAVLARTWFTLGRLHALLAERHNIRGEIIQGSAGNVFTPGVKLTEQGQKAPRLEPGDEWSSS